MAHRKAGGTAKNLRDSNPKYLGIKINHKQKINAGCIIIRQRGTKFIPGKNVGIGTDHTLFAKSDGAVNITNKRKILYTGKVVKRKLVEVI
ncbi:MAG: 50S ribosomal protein L27 [Candidatus Pacebacteria bacterium]|nr:50S ribosomal protein L27 [Candidatus Paceibacterota bacterium]